MGAGMKVLGRQDKYMTEGQVWIVWVMRMFGEAFQLDLENITTSHVYLHIFKLPKDHISFWRNYNLNFAFLIWNPYLFC